MIDDEQIVLLMSIGNEVSAEARETMQEAGEDEYGLKDMVLQIRSRS